MNVKEFVKKELSGWTLGERIFIFLTVVAVLLLSLWMKDSKIATIYAIFGFLATYISGKGKISCYFFGIIAVLLYSYLAWKNSLYGSLILYLGYYLPMEFIGLFLWKNHLKKDTQEIEKTFLSDRERVIYGVLAVIMSVAVGGILLHIKNIYSIISSEGRKWKKY